MRSNRRFLVDDDGGGLVGGRARRRTRRRHRRRRRDAVGAGDKRHRLVAHRLSAAPQRASRITWVARALARAAPFDAHTHRGARSARRVARAARSPRHTHPPRASLRARLRRVVPRRPLPPTRTPTARLAPRASCSSFLFLEVVRAARSLPTPTATITPPARALCASYLVRARELDVGAPRPEAGLHLGEHIRLRLVQVDALAEIGVEIVELRGGDRRHAPSSQQ